jgi:hypothetical protein
MLPTMAEADDQIEAIGGLHQLFTRRAIDYWLFGGWAVDFHTGRVTRRHADIDVAVWQTDFERIDGVLGEDGWTGRALPGEDGYTEYENDVHHLDLALLVRDEEGIVYTPLIEGRGAWPTGSFGDDVRELEGISARVVTLSSLIEDKSQAHGREESTARKDRADVAVLVGLSSEE